MSIVQMAFAAFLLALASPAAAEETRRIPAAIHLHTTFSTGVYTPEELIEIAHAAGVRVAIVTDHDTMRFDYGLPLMPWLTGRMGGYLLERPSILKLGARNYLSRLEEIGESYPDMVILPGVEAIPFFCWQGSPWGGDLTLRRGNEHILVIGLERPGAFEALPSVGHRTFPSIPLATVLSLWPLALAYFGRRLCKAGRRPLRVCGLVCFGAAGIFLVQNLPFRFPKYDPYHGDQGIRPFQDLIDYANAQGALTFWAHPEQDRDEEVSSGFPILDSLTGIRMKTPPYHEDLLKARRYTGVAVFAEGLKYVVPPGGVWDQALVDYVEGRRERPVWGIGEVDFKDPSFPITSTLTFLFVKDVSKASVLDALRKGRAYAVHGPHVQNIALESFVVEGGDGATAGMGEEIEVNAPPRLRFRTVSADTASGDATQVRVIRNGFEVHKDRGVGGGIDWTFEDTSLKPGDRVYYRLDVEHRTNRIATNPIFVTYKP
jgi:hypothetical protein